MLLQTSPWPVARIAAEYGYDCASRGCRIVSSALWPVAQCPACHPASRVFFFFRAVIETPWRCCVTLPYCLYCSRSLSASAGFVSDLARLIVVAHHAPASRPIRVRCHPKQGPFMSFRDIAAALLVVWVWGSQLCVINVLPAAAVAGRPALCAGSAAGRLADCPPALPWPYVLAYGLSMGVVGLACLFSAMAYGMPARLASVVLQGAGVFHPAAGRAVAGRAHCLASLSSGFVVRQCRFMADCLHPWRKR